MDNLIELETLVLDFLMYRTKCEPCSEYTVENSKNYQQGIVGGLHKRLHPMVVDVLNQNEYDGSPLYEDILSREYIAQLVDQVIIKAKNTLNDIEEIFLEEPHGLWSRFRLLHSFVELAVLNEIFGFRREYYKQRKYKGFDMGEFL